MFNLKIYRLLLFILFLIPCFAFGKVNINNPATRSDTVDFGMCLVGDSLETFFNIENSDGLRLKIGKSLPSYSLGQIPGYGIQFEEFKEDFPLPFFIERVDRTIFYKYYTKLDLNKYPVGKKRAFLKLSVFNPEVENQRLESGDSLRESDLIAVKYYVLIARKTLKYIDGWESEVRFDSVYVNSDTSRIFWKVQNSFNASLNIDTKKFEMLSPVISGNQEINLYNHSLPLNLPKKKTTVDWQFTYAPKDMLGDSATLELIYKPNPAIQNVFDTTKVKIFGMGVKQDIRLVQNSENIKVDTIDIGRVWVNNNKEIDVVISNYGNIPFGTLNQKITNTNNDEPSQDFFIQSFLKTNLYHLYPEKNDTIKLSFMPSRRGLFEAKLVLESDISTRRISAYPGFARQVVFYVRGIGIEPTVDVESNNVDFGNVVLQPECPRTRDLEYTINNNGNATLFLYLASVDPPFSVKLFDSLSANSKKNIVLSFDANQLGSFQKELVIQTNANFPKNILKLNLKAQSISPKSSDIEIPKTLRAKPGTRIMLPILVKKDDIINAKTYLDTLEYDKSLLEFYDFDKVGNASETAQADISEIIDGGKLAIKLICPGNFNFIKTDTLIKLYFNTYLGEKIKTSINFTKSIFGDGVCVGVLKPVPSNGVFSLDSVCGLEFKAIPRAKGIIKANDIHPNPTNDLLNLNFELSEKSELSIKIFNSFGNLEKTLLIEEFSPGEYIKTLSVHDLEQGFHFCEFLAGNDRLVLPLIINR